MRFWYRFFGGILDGKEVAVESKYFDRVGWAPANERHFVQVPTTKYRNTYERQVYRLREYRRKGQPSTWVFVHQSLSDEDADRIVKERLQ